MEQLEIHPQSASMNHNQPLSRIYRSDKVRYIDELMSETKTTVILTTTGGTFPPYLDVSMINIGEVEPQRVVYPKYDLEERTYGVAPVRQSKMRIHIKKK